MYISNCRIPSSTWCEHTGGRGPVTLLKLYSKANIHLNVPTAKCMPLKVRVWQSTGGGSPTPNKSFLDYLEILVFILS